MTALALATACGCITGNSAEQKTADAAKPTAGKEEGARVQPAWQDYLVKALSESTEGATEAYGLFSEGGWADAGQIMVIVGKDKPGRVLVVKPGRKKVEVDRPLTALEWAALKPILADSSTLASIDATAFDALTFELAHAVKASDGTVIDRRVFYCNPGTKQAPRHEALISAFQALRAKP
jgi:hypothetical protein